MLSHLQLFMTPWTAAHQASLSFTMSQSLLKFMSIESMMPSNHLILCHPIFLLTQSCSASGSFPVSWLFASGGQSIEASTSASVFPTNEYWGLISFRLTGLILSVHFLLEWWLNQVLLKAFECPEDSTFYCLERAKSTLF